MLVIKSKFFEEFSGHNSHFFDLGVMVIKAHLLITFHKGTISFGEFYNHFDMADIEYLLKTEQVTITKGDVYIGSTELIGVN